VRTTSPDETLLAFLQSTYDAAADPGTGTVPRRAALGRAGLMMSKLQGADAAAELRTVTVHGNAAGFAQEISVGPHRISGDESIAAERTDTGPSPYDLLAASVLHVDDHRALRRH
jgi:hypothetical protein